MHALTRRRIIWGLRIAGAGVLCMGLLAVWPSDVANRTQARHEMYSGESPTQFTVNTLDPLFSVKGRPTSSFRDNLRSDTKYVTSWGSGGLSNDVIGNMNLIYLGMITERVPVLPVFLPSHAMMHSYGNDHSPLPFGDVFDLPRLRKAIKKPLLEWLDVKTSNSSAQMDEIGCWNVWESIQYFDPAPRQSFAPWFLKLDISYTKTPSWIKMKPNFEHDRFSSFWALATLAFPRGRNANLVPPVPTKNNASLAPDEHMLCYDFLYYLAAHQSDEIEKDYSPAWREVGQHLHWTASLERLANDYIRRTLHVRHHEPIPPFISIHVRHKDFKSWCEKDVSLEECYASLPVIQRRVREVQDELKETKGIEASHVIVTSDEKNGTWWRDVHEMGWFGVDHSRTKELYGQWYPILIDAVIQSKGAGFVGTDRSTMSMLSTRRVQSWQEGPVRTVKWGKLGADDH
ncbi:hypothetical protein B0H16DRAFT_1755951 [Mycena metata]|uniref:Uncharacterized protein n=1 Tax=Mycena metata TaxID=1033252 RepID=A0AAD7KIW7_9AGAR|nr:hypothetical protein B0H16DRAFT_1755951 [Mycena metata]